MNRKLYKSKTDVKVAGVCAGFAEFFGVDTTVVRLLWAIMTFFGGTGMLLYIMCMFIMPTEY